MPQNTTPDPAAWFKSTYDVEAENTDELFAQYNAQYSNPVPDTPNTWHTPGTVVTFNRTAHGIILNCSYARLALRWFSPACLRVWLMRHDTPDESPDSPALLPDATDHEPVSLSILDEQGTITIFAGAYRYVIHTAQTTLTVYTDEDATALYETRLFEWSDSGAVRLTMVLQDDESCYGTGERTFNLNLRGRALSLWNTDSGSYERGDEPINYCVPFYTGVHTAGAYGVLVDNPHRGTIDAGYEQPNLLKFVMAAGDLCAYFIAGPDVNPVIEQFTALTGRMQLPPLWATGYHQCRYSYMSQDDVLDVARTLREKNIPADAIYLDIHYMRGYRVFTWDEDRFPELPEMIAELHDLNFRLVTIVDPGVKIDPDYSGYQTGIEDDVFLTLPDGKPAPGEVWPGLCHHPDFSRQAVRDWWGEQLHGLLSAGVDGLWNDMNEPAIFSADGPTTYPDYVQHHPDDRSEPESHLRQHNLYGTQMGDASLRALEKYRPDKRQFNIIRAGYAGSQRFASSWTGDNRSTWDDLKLAIPMNLNLSLSGQSFTGPDLGGFAGDTDGELMVRWMQACVLFPFYRNHSAVDTIRQEPWQFDEETERLCRKAIRLRYQLLPYLYTQFAICHADGTPIMRPLFTLEAENPVLRDIDDCYLVGDHLLIAPILQAHTLRRSVYLPAGYDWYDFYSGDRHHGGQFIMVAAALDTVPIFVRAGAVIPSWSAIHHADEQPEFCKLTFYAGEGSSRLYEDAGEGLDYQSGASVWHRFNAHEEVDSVWVIRHRKTGNYTAPYETFWHVVGLDETGEIHIIEDSNNSDDTA